MTIRAFHLADSRQLVQIEAFSAPSDIPDVTPCWIDIEGEGPDEVCATLVALGLSENIHSVAIEDVYAPRVLPFEDAFFLSAPTEASSTIDHAAPYLSILCNDDYLITVHDGPIGSLKGVGRELSRDQRLYAAHPAMLMLQVLLHAMYANNQLVFQTRSQVESLRREFAAAPDGFRLSDLATLKRRVERLSVIADDQLFCANALLLIKTGSFNIERQRDLYRDMANLCRNSTNWIDALEGQLRDIHSEYTLTVQRRTEDRVNLLTMITAIFLPLTLITGIYGMNFIRMPELRWTLGYAFAIGLMVLIAVALGAYFYRLGWFRHHEEPIKSSHSEPTRGSP